MNPETDESKKGKEPNTSVGGEKSWFQKWLELIKHLMSSKDLEAIAVDLSGGNIQVKDAIAKAGSVMAGVETQDKRRFFDSLVEALLNKDDEEVQSLLRGKLSGPEESSIFEPFIEQVRRRKEGNEIPTNEKDEYEGARSAVDRKVNNGVDSLKSAVQSKGGDDERDELEAVMAGIREQKERLEGEEPNAEWFRKSTMHARKELSRLQREKKIDAGEAALKEYVLNKTESFLEKWYESGELPEMLSREEELILKNYLLRAPSGEKVVRKKLLLQLLANSPSGSETEAKLASWAYEPQDNGRSQTGADRKQRVDSLIDDLDREMGGNGQFKDLLNRMMSSVGGDEAELRGSGLRYLNINPDLYPKVNVDLKNKLHIDFDALVRDEETGLWKVSDRLPQNKKDELTAIIFDRLAAEVRMAVDEGVDLREKQYEPLLRTYNTLTAIVGLDTAQKSEVKQKLNFEVMAFMLFNSYTDKRMQEMIAELASHIGAESNIFMGMLRRRETFTIKNAEGKEIDVGAFNLYDFARTMGRKVTNIEDRRAYGITKSVDEVGRTHATMMYASNKPEEKVFRRGIVTRATIVDVYGQEHYNNLVRQWGGGRIDGANMATLKVMENEMLTALSKKYFDYPSGVYVYWRMTNQMADYVGNAHIDNTKLTPPAGMPEALWKNDMKLLYLFHEKYSGVKHVNMLLWLRTAFNSMMVKEASEVWSWLINLDENPTSKVESVFTGLFGGARTGKNDERLSAATTVQQAILGAMFEDEKIHLSKHNHHLHKLTEDFESMPAKRDENGLLVIDTMTRRRDWGTFEEMMLKKMSTWGDDVYDKMDFAFLAEKFKHNKRIAEVLGANLGEVGEDKRGKFEFLMRNMSDEMGLFDNLSQKRPDDPMKYNLENYAAASAAALALAQDVSYANAAAFIVEIQKVSGVGKVGDLAIMVMKRVREMREAMGLAQSYTVPKKINGQLKIDSESWVGDLPGSFPLYELEQRWVTPNDILSHPEGVSKATLAGNIKGIDKEEIEYKYALDGLNEYNVLSEEEYKEAVKEFYKEIRGWNARKNPISEAWAFVSGKKFWGYWAARLNVPEEMLKKWVFEGGGELFGLWWKYFNGVGAAHH